MDGVIEGSLNNGAMGKMSAMIPTIEKMLPKLDFDHGQASIPYLPTLQSTTLYKTLRALLPT